jgi:hypothetical protein
MIEDTCMQEGGDLSVGYKRLNYLQVQKRQHILYFANQLFIQTKVL